MLLDLRRFSNNFNDIRCSSRRATAIIWNDTHTSVVSLQFLIILASLSTRTAGKVFGNYERIQEIQRRYSTSTHFCIGLKAVSSL